ncbi:MAG: T9SS type A sorting domain-containing protein [Cryomorphaceae bacterium]|jgi:hypothetical protein|nr:T9SS type A sorting domain-containing protein [Cryomorphaceae bacterium]
MTKISLVLVFFLSCFASHAQLEKVIVEKYYITDLNDASDLSGGTMAPGTTTYRVYVDMLPNTRLKSVYGATDHPLIFQSTLPFYNHATDGQSYAKEFLKNRYSEGLVALDTWMTLGQTTKTQAGKTYFGVPKVSDTDGSFIGGTNNDGGSAAIASGLMINTDSQMGLPLTTADGMDTMAAVPSAWLTLGLVDIASGQDTTIFGSVQQGTSLISEEFLLQNSGVSGVDPLENQVLIAQLTTAGELSFELNLELEVYQNGAWQTKKYVARDTVLQNDESFNAFLSYPFLCGCTDPSYLEYSPAFACLEDGSCITPVVMGCMDTNACNYDANVNVNVSGLCCYPGNCGGRDIAVVCPQLWEDNFEVSMYPNPTENNMTITANGDFLNKEISWTLNNTFGVSIQSAQFTPTSASNLEIDIDLSGSQAGVYFLEFTVGDLKKSEILIKTK